MPHMFTSVPKKRPLDVAPSTSGVQSPDAKRLRLDEDGLAHRSASSGVAHGASQHSMNRANNVQRPPPQAAPAPTHQAPTFLVPVPMYGPSIYPYPGQPAYPAYPPIYGPPLPLPTDSPWSNYSLNSLYPIQPPHSAPTQVAVSSAPPSHASSVTPAPVAPSKDASRSSQPPATLKDDASTPIAVAVAITTSDRPSRSTSQPFHASPTSISETLPGSFLSLQSAPLPQFSSNAAGARVKQETPAPAPPAARPTRPPRTPRSRGSGTAQDAIEFLSDEEVIEISDDDEKAPTAAVAAGSASKEPDRSSSDPVNPGAGSDESEETTGYETEDDWAFGGKDPRLPTSTPGSTSIALDDTPRLKSIPLRPVPTNSASLEPVPRASASTTISAASDNLLEPSAPTEMTVSPVVESALRPAASRDVSSHHGNVPSASPLGSDPLTASESYPAETLFGRLLPPAQPLVQPQLALPPPPPRARFRIRSSPSPDHKPRILADVASQSGVVTKPSSGWHPEPDADVVSDDDEWAIATRPALLPPKDTGGWEPEPDVEIPPSPIFVGWMDQLAELELEEVDQMDLDEHDQDDLEETGLPEEMQRFLELDSQMDSPTQSKAALPSTSRATASGRSQPKGSGMARIRGDRVQCTVCRKLMLPATLDSHVKLRCTGAVNQYLRRTGDDGDLVPGSLSAKASKTPTPISSSKHRPVSSSSTPVRSLLEELTEDAWAKEVEDGRVLCSGCDKWIELGGALTRWSGRKGHKSVCPPIVKATAEAQAEERHRILNHLHETPVIVPPEILADSRLRKTDGDQALCTVCGTWMRFFKWKDHHVAGGPCDKKVKKLNRGGDGRATPTSDLTNLSDLTGPSDGEEGDADQSHTGAVRSARSNSTTTMSTSTFKAGALEDIWISPPPPAMLTKAGTPFASMMQWELPLDLLGDDPLPESTTSNAPSSSAPVSTAASSTTAVSYTGTQNGVASSSAQAAEASSAPPRPKVLLRMTKPFEQGADVPLRIIERKLILKHDSDAADVDETGNTVRCRYCKKCIVLEPNMVPSNLWYGPQGHVAVCTARKEVVAKSQLPQESAEEFTFEPPNRIRAIRGRRVKCAGHTCGKWVNFENWEGHLIKCGAYGNGKKSGPTSAPYRQKSAETNSALRTASSSNAAKPKSSSNGAGVKRAPFGGKVTKPTGTFITRDTELTPEIVSLINKNTGPETRASIVQRVNELFADPNVVQLTTDRQIECKLCGRWTSLDVNMNYSNKWTGPGGHLARCSKNPAAVKPPADQPSSADQSSLARQLPPRQRPRTLAESSEEDKDGDSEFDVAAELAAFDSNDEFDELPGLKRR